MFSVSHSKLYLLTIIVCCLVLLLKLSLFDDDEREAADGNAAMRLARKLPTVALLRAIADRARAANEKEEKALTKQCPRWTEWTRAFRDCLVTSLTRAESSQVWRVWHDEWRRCLNATGIADAVKRFRLHFHQNGDDVKATVEAASSPMNSWNGSACTVVTLGVGGDILAEQSLRRMHPECRFFGADPIAEFGKVYEQVGRYFEIAVGDKIGEMRASVLKNASMNATLSRLVYVWRTVPSVDLLTFLQRDVRAAQIDHLWMDNEGPEYRLTPNLTRGALLARNNISICQLNAEWHFPVESYGVTLKQFGEMAVDFLRNSDFVLLNLNPPGGHHRPFFFNANNSYCVRRYLSDWCD